MNVTGRNKIIFFWTKNKFVSSFYQSRKYLGVLYNSSGTQIATTITTTATNKIVLKCDPGEIQC